MAVKPIKEEFILVGTFFEEMQDRLSLKMLTKDNDIDRKIISKDLCRPGLAITGFFDVFSFEKIQILGNTESAYISKMKSEEIRQNINRIMEYQVPCFVVTHNNKVTGELIELAEKKRIPVFRTPLSTLDAYHKLIDYLEEKFAYRMTVHASLVDVYGVGVMFIGRSGIGKSEISLDLIERGHRLVADDTVTLIDRGDGIIMGKGNDMIGHHVEIRGIGIIDAGQMFGVRAIRMQKRVEVVVQLEDQRDITEFDRTGLDPKFKRFLSVDLPVIDLPIFPGKNITVIAESIAMNHLSKYYGYDAAQELNKRLKNRLSRKKIISSYLAKDSE